MTRGRFSEASLTGGESMLCRGLLIAAPVLALMAAAPETRAQDENPLVKLVKSKVKDPAKPFAILVEIKVKAGKEKEFEAAFAPFLEATRKEPGCVAFHMNRDADHPEVYVFYEQFKSVAALDAHVKQKYTATLLKAIRPISDGETKTKVYAVPE
jgi:quinol monooxygenase YgiN